MLRRFLLACLLALYVASADASLHVRDGGAWREIQEVYVRDVNTWRRIQEIYVRDGGTWRLVFQGDVISISNRTVESITTSPDDSLATYTLNSSGTITQSTTYGGTTNLGNWVTPTGSASSYEVVCTLSSGTLSSGTCNGSAQALSSSRAWSVSRTLDTTGVNQAIIVLQIRRISDSAVMGTATITLRAQVDL